MEDIVKSLDPEELFDLGWFFRNAVGNAKAQYGFEYREFARCLTAETGNEKLNKILIHISRSIKLGEGHPVVFAKKELYKLLNG